MMLISRAISKDAFEIHAVLYIILGNVVINFVLMRQSKFPYDQYI